MVSHNPSRSCVPASRGSVFAVEIARVFLLSASVTNPVSGLADQEKMQIEIQQRQRRLVSLRDARDEALRLVPQEDHESFNPGFVDFLAADLFIAEAEVQPDETDEFLHLPGCRGLFQVGTDINLQYGAARDGRGEQSSDFSAIDPISLSPSRPKFLLRRSDH